ncbi:MAG TPA: hypothetical protein VLA72_06545 [Anaerolineales bacterium]|nr:hypothetical protein [Anaerolineales bacterium]
MNKKKLLILLITAILLVSCGGSSVDSPPLVYLVKDGELIDGFQSSYCWDDGAGAALCVDTVEPYFDETTHLSTGGLIQFLLDTPLPDEVTLSLSKELFGDIIISETVAVVENIDWSPAVDSGEYILTVHAKWTQGDVAYWFRVSLE